MTTTWLAYFPSPPRGVWHLGPLPIRAYGLFIIAGIVVALLIADRRWAARGGQRGVVYDIAWWAVPFGLLGGRLYHLATDWRLYFGPGGGGIAAAVRIWDGGLGIWGAVALGGVGAWIACRRRGIPLPAFADAIAPGIILAQAIGRLGNYFNQELYGRETTLPWGLEIFCRQDPAGFVGGEGVCRTGTVHSLDGVSTGQVAFVVQPTFLYELIWNVLVFVALIYLDRRFALSHGRLFALYVALYCAGRFWIELLRDDDATHIAGIRINSFTSTFVFIGAVVYIILATKGREEPRILGGTEFVAKKPPEPEPTAELASAAPDAAPTVAAPAGPKEDEKLVDFSEVAKPEEPAEAEVAEAEPAETEPAAEEAEVIEPEAAEVAAPEVAEVAETAPEVAEAAVAEPEVGRWLRRLRSRRQKARRLEAAEPEAAEAEAAEPEAAEAEAAEPEVAERVVAEPEPAEPALAEPEPAEPEAVEPEAVEPEVAEPVVAEPEAVEPEAAEPEVAEPEAAEPEPESEVAEPEVAEPEVAEAEPEPEAAEPEAVEAEAVEPETAEATHTEAADVEAEDAKQPEVEEPKDEEAEAEAKAPEAEAAELEPEAVEAAAEEETSSEPDLEAVDREEHPESEAAEEPAEESPDVVEELEADEKTDAAAGTEAPVAEKVDEDEATPTPTPPAIPGPTNSTRERWRQRLRNLRPRSGR